MNNSGSLSWRRLPLSQNKVPPKWWVLGMLGLSFAGFLDSAYLTLKHYLGFEVPCSVLEGCEQVLTSQYATWFGISVAVPGALYYLTVFLLIVAFLDRKRLVFLNTAALLPVAGFLFTLWFLFAQAFLLGAFCPYCLLSGFLTAGLFALSLHYFWHGSRTKSPRATVFLRDSR